VRDAITAAENGKSYVTEEEGANIANFIDGGMSTIGADSPI